MEQDTTWCQKTGSNDIQTFGRTTSHPRGKGNSWCHLPSPSPTPRTEKTKTQTLLLHGADKTTLQNILKSIAIETISMYPDSSILATYIDDPAVRAIHNGSHGSFIKSPDMEEPILLSGHCGTYCTNYDAEVVAIKMILDTIRHHLEERNLRPNEILRVTVSNSSNGKLVGRHCQGHRTHCSNMWQDQNAICNGIEITIQWIPGHSDIKMNEKPDGHAKRDNTCSMKISRPPMTLQNRLQNKTPKKFCLITGWKMTKEKTNVTSSD